MRDAPAEREMLDAFEPEETGSVDIGNVGAHDQCGHGKAGLPLEARLSNQRADEAVRQVIH